MALYRKTALIEATQWFKNGDHPDDRVGEILHDPFAQKEANDHYARQEGAVVRYFRHPDVPGTSICASCSRTMHDHGWIDDLEGGHTVCPGDFIPTGVHGEHWAVKPDIFAESYEQVSK